MPRNDRRRQRHGALDEDDEQHRSESTWSERSPDRRPTSAPSSSGNASRGRSGLRGTLAAAAALVGGSMRVARLKGPMAGPAGTRSGGIWSADSQPARRNRARAAFERVRAPREADVHREGDDIQLNAGFSFAFFRLFTCRSVGHG